MELVGHIRERFTRTRYNKFLCSILSSIILHQRIRFVTNLMGSGNGIGTGQLSGVSVISIRRTRTPSRGLKEPHLVISSDSPRVLSLVQSDGTSNIGLQHQTVTRDTITLRQRHNHESLGLAGTDNQIAIIYINST